MLLDFSWYGENSYDSDDNENVRVVSRAHSPW